MNRSVAMLLIGLIFGAGIGFTIAAGAGVTLDGHDHNEHLADGADHSQMDHGEAHSHDTILSLPKGPNAPTLEIKAVRDSSTGWNLRIITTNFFMTAARVGSGHVAGEGHAHVYLNGIKQARVYGEWYHIDNVPEGETIVRVTLNSNDHSALAVGEVPIAATLTLAGN